MFYSVLAALQSGDGGLKPLPMRATRMASTAGREASPEQLGGNLELRGECIVFGLHFEPLAYISRARQPVDFKHEGGVWLAKEPFVETPNGAQPGYPIRQAGTAPPLAPPPLA